MGTTRRVGTTALTAVIALALVAVPATMTVLSMTAPGTGSPTLTPATTLTPGAVAAGEVVLTTTSTKGTITYKGAVQEFTGGQQCEVTPVAGSANLLRVVGSVGTGQSGVAGFRDGDIGVFETGTVSPDNASQCFRVDAGSTTTRETLTLELPADGPYSDEPFSERLVAERATVDARVGNTRSGEIEISLQRSDGSWVPNASAFWSNQKAGSRITFPSITGAFTAIRLASKTGSFSVRGATLSLVSQAQEIFCNPGNPTGGTFTDTDGPTTVSYLGNADESNSCFGVRLTGGDQSYQWLKPLTVNQDAQFVFDQVWTLPIPSVPDYDLPKAYINFELTFPATTAGGQPTPSVDHELLFCPDWLYPNGDPRQPLALITDDATVEQDGQTVRVLDALDDLDMEPEVAGVIGTQGTQFACLDKKSRSSRIVLPTATDAGGLKLTDKVFLIGDARIRIS